MLVKHYIFQLSSQQQLNTTAADTGNEIIMHITAAKTELSLDIRTVVINSLRSSLTEQ